jgi:2-polyprenyl-3-methyl-5-hydroxy-6-metoxy-1,4-benzoquinol methylase
METVPCPISDSTAFTPFLKVPDRFDDPADARWQLVRSSASGLIMLNPRPDSAESAAHYHSGSYDPYLHAAEGISITGKAYLTARAILLGYRAAIILKGANKQKKELALLEIGCSTGDLLNYLHKSKGVAKNNLTGVEPDPESRGYGRERYGLNIYPAVTDMKALGEQNGSPKKFDRIVLWHALEHIHALNDTLAQAKELLAQEGMLVLALPNPASTDAKHYRENWIAWDAPRHLYHFVPDTLEKLLALHNLEIISRRPYLPDSLYNTIHSEKLLCKREKRGFHAPQLGVALLKALAAAAIGALQPLKASSLVYFVKERT